jgi:hypothetical protein
MLRGIHQGFKPSFAFTGKLAATHGGKKAEKEPALNAETEYDRAVSWGYHATVPKAVEGEQEAKRVLNLVGGQGDAVEVLREQILNNCFRELEAADWSRWEHLLGRSIGWKDLAKAIRLSLCKEEAAEHRVELPQWYFMTGESREEGLVPYHPVIDELPLDKHEEQLPIMTIAEWLEFIRADLITTKIG